MRLHHRHKDGNTLSLKEVQALLRDHLAAFKLPSRVAMVDEFALNAMGKIRKDVLIE